MSDQELLSWGARLGGQQKLLEAARIMREEDIGEAQAAWRLGLSCEVVEAVVRTDISESILLAA